MKKSLLILCILFICFCTYKIYTKVTIIELPQGELKWSKTKPLSAKLCVPAAFSSIKDQVVGVHRENGISYGKDKKYKVSIMDNSFTINRSWQSNNGFQQIILVKDNKPFDLGNSPKKRIRRALGKNQNKTFIIESNYPMTMTTFANYCSKHCSDAIYLDMGEYGYGYIKCGLITYPLYPVAYAYRHKQTNWLYIQ
jgi:hypothetical protein